MHAWLSRTDARPNGMTFFCQRQVHFTMHRCCVLPACLHVTVCICLVVAGVTLVKYTNEHNHRGSIQCNRQNNAMPPQVKGRIMDLLRSHTPSQTWMTLISDGDKLGLKAEHMVPYIPTFRQVCNQRGDQLKAIKSFAGFEALMIQEKFPRHKGIFIISMYLYENASSELFILLGTRQSLTMLCDHGDNVFYMDGMHGINAYKNNQIVTINVRVGNRGFPCAYLITVR
jgi:hypothetical protein